MIINPCYKNTVVIKQETEMREEGVGTVYEDADNGKCEENGSLINGFDPHEDNDSKVQIKTTENPAPELSTTPASAANIEELYVRRREQVGLPQQTKMICTLCQ